MVRPDCWNCYSILLDSFGCANTTQHTDALKILFTICDLEHTRCHHTLLPLLSVRTLGIRRRKIWDQFLLEFSSSTPCSENLSWWFCSTSVRNRSAFYCPVTYRRSLSGGNWWPACSSPPGCLSKNGTLTADVAPKAHWRCYQDF